MPGKLVRSLGSEALAPSEDGSVLPTLDQVPACSAPHIKGMTTGHIAQNLLYANEFSMLMRYLEGAGSKSSSGT